MRVTLLLYFLGYFKFSNTAIGDSRLRISVSNSMPSFASPSESKDLNTLNTNRFREQNKDYTFKTSSAMHQGAVVRLYDPLSDVTYHQSDDPRLVEALGKMWNPRLHPYKCGAKDRFQRSWQTSTTTSSRYQSNRASEFHIESYVCDPENILLSQQAEEIDEVIQKIPKTTGCQCDSMSHCNQYTSGYTIYVAVVPFKLEQPKGHGGNVWGFKSRINGSDTARRLKFSTTTNWGTSLVDRALSLTKSFDYKILSSLNLPAVSNIETTNLIITREMSGIEQGLLPKDADIYHLLPLYLRASWASGECDEDMVICFFPEERKLSISVGGRLFDKLTSSCLNALFTTTKNKLSKVAKPKKIRNQGRKKGRLNFVKTGNIRWVNENTASSPTSSISPNETKELTEIFHEFIMKLKDLVNSRQDNPCAISERTKWSNIDILSFAAMTGLGLSASVMVLLRLCSIFWDMMDEKYESSSHKPIFGEKPPVPSALPSPSDKPDVETQKAKSDSTDSEFPSISIVDNNFTEEKDSKDSKQDSIDGSTLVSRPKGSLVYLPTSSIRSVDESSNIYEAVLAGSNKVNQIEFEGESLSAVDTLTATSGNQFEKDSLMTSTLKSSSRYIVVTQMDTLTARDSADFKPSKRPTAV